MKEQFLQQIQLQVNELTSYYEKQIVKLERENIVLKKKVQQLEKQIAKYTNSVQQPATKIIEQKPVAAKPVTIPNEKKIPVKKTAPLPSISLKKQQKDGRPPEPAPKKAKAPFSIHNFHIIHEADLKLFVEEYELEEREISVALFDVEGVEETDKSVQLHAYVNPTQTEAFILEQAFKAARTQYKPYRLLGSRKHYSSDWHTDLILQKEGSLKRYLNFSAASELEDFGYQVRTLSTEERWAILQEALPIIGLEKIAKTLAGHIEQRKAKENGEQFYAAAIEKWQSDLTRLKKHFFNRDFTWPK